MRPTQLAAILAAASDGPAMTADFTSAIPSGWTFSRTGTRTAIQSGAIASVASGAPAFESWLSQSRGLSINPAVTNVTTYTSDATNAAWAPFGNGGAVVSAGGTSPAGAASIRIQENGGTSRGVMIRVTAASIPGGTLCCFQGFVRRVSGSARWGVRVRMDDENGSAGPRAFLRLDGPQGAYFFDSAKFTNTQLQYVQVSADTYFFALSGVSVATAKKEMEVVPVWQDSASGNLASYTADTSSAFELMELQYNTGGASAPILTGATTASVNADSCIASAPSWLNASAGTLMIEHDCQQGVLIGSGSNVVLSAQGQPGRTAIAWDGSGARISHNGNAPTSVSTPTFGSDIRLLATSSTTNSGRVKALKAWTRKLSDAELQAVAKPARVTASPGALRAVAKRNVLPAWFTAASGSNLTVQTRFKVEIAGGDVASLKFRFPNFKFGSTGANDMSISLAALERETGVAESVPITFSGGRTATMTPGAGPLSDEILPGAFSGLSTFTNGMVFWVRMRVSVASAGQEITYSRWTSETNSFAVAYNPAAAGSISAIDATGVMTQNKTGASTLTRGPSAIALGTYANGDPLTVMGLGDSLMEGTSVTTGCFVNKAVNAVGSPFLELAAGGSSALTISETTHWRPYMAYARVIVDTWDTNEVNRLLHHFTIWHEARTTYNVDKIVTVGLPPRGASTDSWATEANQTATAGRTYPGNPEWFRLSTVANGLADYYLPNVAARGVDLTKWIVNGTANYATTDGTHQTAAADALMATALGTLMAGVVVT